MEQQEGCEEGGKKLRLKGRLQFKGLPVNIFTISQCLVVILVVNILLGKVGIVVVVVVVAGIMRSLAQGPGPPGILHCTVLS